MDAPPPPAPPRAHWDSTSVVLVVVLLSNLLCPDGVGRNSNEEPLTEHPRNKAAY